MPLLPGTDDHGELVFGLGVAYDTRDDEVNTTTGMYHQLSTRFSVGPMLGTDYSWGGTTLNLRFFAPFIGEYLSFAGRIVVVATSNATHSASPPSAA